MKVFQLERETAAFQQPVDEADLCLQLARRLPGEEIIEVLELEAGLFNNAYRVNTSTNAYILKVAPESGADVYYNEKHLMQRERTISRQLQALSPLIPRYLSFFTVGGRDAFLQPLIEGRLWHEEMDALSDAENARLWEQLGAFARTLHRQRGETFGYPAPCRGFSRWSGFVADNVRGMVEDCRRLNLYCPEVETYCSYLPQFFPILDRVTTPRLVHGDLWPRNVIIEGAGADIRIKAVFDAERAYWGDPVSDWVLILLDFPETFWQGYGENLLQTRDAAAIAVYKGMYFILNILETNRFNESPAKPRQWLSSINTELGKLRK